MLPDEVCHVTALSDADPTSVAVNEMVPPVLVEMAAGEIETEVIVGVGDDAVTVTVATPVTCLSASLVAVTTEVPALDGAV
jgi:hypothetical protein